MTDTSRIQDITNRLTEIEQLQKRLEAASQDYMTVELDTGVCRDGAINCLYDGYAADFQEEHFLREELDELRE